MLKILFGILLIKLIVCDGYKLSRKEHFNTIVENINYNDVKFKIETIAKNHSLPVPVLSNVIVPGNNLYIGHRIKGDQWLYTDNTKIENNGPAPSTVNALIEIYLDVPILITHVEVTDQIKDGTGGIPTYHSGGINHNWVKINVQGLYTKGFHFLVHIFGIPDAPNNTINKTKKNSN